MLQISYKKLIVLTIAITSFSACGLLKKGKKIEKTTTEVVKEPKEALKEEKIEPKTVTPNIVEMNTTMGKITLKLYDGTPLHKENFGKLIAENYYNDVLFHRVIKNFMIQGGDPNSKNKTTSSQLGNGGPKHTIPAEFSQKYYHKKGALCAARQGDNINPEQRSSGSQFYIVTGAIYSIDDIKQMENRINEQAKNNLMRMFWRNPKNQKETNLYSKYKSEGKMDSLNILQNTIKKQLLLDYKPYKFNEEQIKTYTTIGGTPFLDNNYTVFGEVIEGLDIVDKIGNSETNREKPVEDIKIISVKIIE